MRLDADFFARDVLEVAPDLIGRHIRHGPVTLAITEVEAYREGDSASHTRFGKTARNAVMYGPPGRLYVYLCYGLHQMVNLVTHPEGAGAAVLIRACAPVDGLETIRARRGGKSGPVLLTGPGKVGAALALDTRWTGHPVHAPGGVELLEGAPPSRILAGPRVGIDYALPEDRDVPWRFAADSAWVSHRKALGLWP